MSRDEAIVDITTDPITARAARRRAVFRIAMPILGAVLMIAVILVIAIQLNDANRRGALKLADDVLAATDARIVEQVTNYFAIPTRALQEGESIARNAPAGEQRRALVESFSLGAMERIPQIADFIIGDAEGNFIMVRRAESGGIDTKLIQNAPGPRQVIWIRRNVAGDEIGREEDPTDAYDPRTRSWYSGALAASGVFWSDVYIFFTAKEPGITASTRYLSPEGHRFVVGVDIALANLSEFLANLKIGANGRAMIISGQGQVIAYPKAERIVKRDVSGPMAARVDEIGDAAAAGGYDHFRVDGPGRETIVVDGKRYLASLTPLQSVGRNWAVMIVVPENDFIGFVERSNGRALIMSLGIVALAALGALLLVIQGLRGGRAARMVRDRSEAITRRSEALALAADEFHLFDPTRAESAQCITKAAADIAGARRVSLWHLTSNGNALHCADSFDAETTEHTRGSELHCGELPHFLGHLTTGTAIDVADAGRDPRTAEIHRLVMSPLGSRSLSVIPIRRRELVTGAIWLEDAANIEDSRNFLRVLASMAALRGAAAERRPVREAIPRVSEPVAAQSVSTDLTPRGLDVKEADYPGVCVLAVRIGDLNKAKGLDLVDMAVRAVQESAALQNIPYLKLVGRDIVGAAGFGPGDSTATERIAEAAVSVRDRLAALFESSDLEPDFRIGIDIGNAVARSVGSAPSVFNLWGRAVDTAEIMAASALPGAIQTTEAVYKQLRENYLFRPRGAFYLPQVGASRTFVLAGQL